MRTLSNSPFPTALFIAILLLLQVSCSSSDDSGSIGGAVSLIFPENNSECTEGAVVNNDHSTITFQWQSTQAESYEVFVKNLTTNLTANTTFTANEGPITLERGTAYEWYVVAKAGGEENGKSDTWRFYNAGVGTENYAPFPAVAVNPQRGQSVNATSNVNLQWQGNDVDGDITGYEVFFGTSEQTLTGIGSTAQSSMSANVVSGQTYYWRVVTRDGAGNTSQSELFDFRVL